ncbi:MAG TPA: lmo0937 family membrane protein [Bacteroidia bacterium]
MGNALYIVALLLVITWMIGFLGYHFGGLIHLLLVLALISVIYRAFQGRGKTN